MTTALYSKKRTKEIQLNDLEKILGQIEEQDIRDTSNYKKPTLHITPNTYSGQKKGPERKKFLDQEWERLRRIVEHLTEQKIEVLNKTLFQKERGNLSPYYCGIIHCLTKEGNVEICY